MRSYRFLSSYAVLQSSYLRSKRELTSKERCRSGKELSHKSEIITEQVQRYIRQWKYADRYGERGVTCVIVHCSLERSDLVCTYY